ncbi:MAG: isoprenyl transferase [Acidobacteria bacterium]|nr:isoprenyl transferase [Acidobacteriota bacterium]MBS1867861.1 isoprenyl transferase [Acidobacteriota bacterium]
MSQHTPSSKTLHVAASHPLGTVTAEEAYLLEKLDLNQLPRHLAVIMDGNGRWAQKRHLPRIAGHKAGTETARTTIETCARLKIEALTLYAFSVENWRRPKTETDFLMQLLREYLRQEMPLIQRNNIRMRFLGRADDLPAGVQRDTRDAEAETARNTGMVLCVALNYGGRAEIVDAVNRILEEKRAATVHSVTEEEFAERMYTAGLPDPDLLVRTSGEMRVSNFLLWQIAYAEIYVTETLWPDFNRARLLEAFVDFQKRERRYGGIGQGKSRKPVRAAGE